MRTLRAAFTFQSGDSGEDLLGVFYKPCQYIDKEDECDISEQNHMKGQAMLQDQQT